MLSITYVYLHQISERLRFNTYYKMTVALSMTGTLNYHVFLIKKKKRKRKRTYMLQL